MLPVFAVRAERHRRRLANVRLLRERIRMRRESAPFDLPDRRFTEIFRLNKNMVRALIDMIHPHFHQRYLVRGITVEMAVLVTLRYYATGAYQRSVGQDFNFPLSQTSIHRCIHEVTNLINNHLADNFIKFPNTQEERHAIKIEFMDRWQFPGIIGAIDGTHVAILKPSADEHNFINRKGFHSINVQVICDHNMKFLNVNANYGGTTHDSFIWRNSLVQRYMRHLHENEREVYSWLIGDSGYPLQPYLMTPFLNPLVNSPESAYNYAHMRARNVVERALGVLKMRFRCLLKERVARYNHVFVGKLVTACVVLHNMCVTEEIPLIGNFFNYYSGTFN